MDASIGAGLAEQWLADDAAPRAPRRTAGNIETRVSPGADALARLEQPWAELAQEASEPAIFAEHWFMAAALRHLSEGADVRLIEQWQGDRLTGVLPVVVERGYARLPIAYVENWRHHQCFLGTPLVRRGHERAFWRGVIEVLDAAPWAKGLLHVKTLDADGPVLAGLREAAGDLGRSCDIVHAYARAMLKSPLSAQGYYEANVRKKKRKELKRLSNRLAELGKVETRTLSRREDVDAWCEAFLALEQKGWKGKAGSALASSPETAAFFRDVVARALDAGRLDFLRLDLDGRPLAMLVNLLAPPGGFSFKIAHDDDFARFSPGVLIEIENLRLLEREGVDWVDSCALPDHPMINSLWAERREIVRVSVPLSGPLRTGTFHFCRAAERASAAIKQRIGRMPPKPQEHDDE